VKHGVGAIDHRSDGCGVADVQAMELDALAHLRQVGKITRQEIVDHDHTAPVQQGSDQRRPDETRAASDYILGRHSILIV
jgi:hypothetical protein